VIGRVRTATQFLTRLPVGDPPFDDRALQRSIGAFPLVGLIVAVAVCGVRYVAGLVLPDLAATIAAIAAGAIVTGAFHEDGFADTFDGLWGGGTPERRLEIMRDSRLGTYGTLALIMLIAAKLALLAPLPWDAFTRAVVAGMVLGRASSLPLMRWMEPAPGSSAALAGSPSNAALVLGGCTVIITVGVTFGVWAWLPLVAGAAVVLVCAAVIRTKLGGINGDTLGATNQLVEVATYACAAALIT
jgi:adenosylcobinamide-GDP ribazoletransferase